MKFRLKDPGSSITHFIGMLMALFAATPLLIRASMNPDRVHVASLAVFIASMILLYGASATYHALDLSERANRILRKLDHMMIFVLIAGTYTPVCVIVLGGKTGYGLLALVWGIALLGILVKAFWITCQMVFFYIIYCHGMDLCAGIHPDYQFPVTAGVCMAAGRRDYLYRRGRHLCAEAADFQFQAQEFWLP